MRDPQNSRSGEAELLQHWLTERAPGRAIEVRIPPYAAVQCGEGPTHTRGTPRKCDRDERRNLVGTCLSGERSWADAMSAGLI